jgi:hypothetical protein
LITNSCSFFSTLIETPKNGDTIESIQIPLVSVPRPDWLGSPFLVPLPLLALIVERTVTAVRDVPPLAFPTGA